MEKKNPNDERFKEEVKAWLMIQVIGQTGVNILNKKKLEKEMRDHLKAFSDAEKLLEQVVLLFAHVQPLEQF